MSVLAIVDPNGPALRQLGLFVCEDDGDVATINEDVPGGGTVISSP